MSAIRSLDPRDNILEVLTEVYNPKDKGRDWWAQRASGSFLSDVNRDLTISILSHIVAVQCIPADDPAKDYYARTMAQEIQNIIWMMHSGGSTAEYATNEIIKAIGLPIGEQD